MPSETLEVYCDGSVAEARMNSSTTSILLSGQNVGRIAILIPKLDLGVLEQVNETDSMRLEIRAVRRAIEVCERKRISNYLVVTDNKNAELALSEEGKPAKWVWREKNLAGWFLDKIISRARYLRASLRKQPQRRVSQRHEEIFELFNAVKEEFRLSGKILGREVLDRMRREVDPC